MKFQICTKINKNIIDNYDSILFLDENEIEKNFIQQIQEQDVSVYFSKLKYKLFAQYKINQFETYCEQYGKTIFDISVVKEFIKANDLESEFSYFLENDYQKFAKLKSNKEIIQEIVEERIGEIFNNSRYSDIYICRDKDHKMMHCYK